jgi:hypothetical protein
MQGHRTAPAHMQGEFTETLDCHSRERGNPVPGMRRISCLVDSCLAWSGLRPQPRCLPWRNGRTDPESAAVQREFDALGPPAITGTATSSVLCETCKRASRSRSRRRPQCEKLPSHDGFARARLRWEWPVRFPCIEGNVRVLSEMLVRKAKCRTFAVQE